MLIDLHAHTSGISACCLAPASDIVAVAKEIGLEAIEFIDLTPPEGVTQAEYAKELRAEADRLGITIALEVLNRFETLLLTDASEGVQFCRDVNRKSVKVLLDTFHMNIEEDDLPAAIRATGEWLAHLHVGEGNRKLPGMGHLDWTAIGSALKDIGFDGMVVMEPFMKAGGSVGSDIKVWRDLSGNADEEGMDRMIAESVAFLRKAFA